MIQPAIVDVDKIKSEVHRQTSLCECSRRYDVEQIGEGRYRFGESQSLRLVRILRSTVMVRVGGGWTTLDEYLIRHDPCRVKGRTNYEIHPETCQLRNGVAQTVTLFQNRFGHHHRAVCHHQQLSSDESPATSGSDDQSVSPVPISKEVKSNQQQQRKSSKLPVLTSRIRKTLIKDA